MELTPQNTPDVLSQLEPYQLFALVGAFTGVGALLKVLLESVRGGFWKQALRVLSSAFWGTLAAILVSDWLTLSPKSLLVLATLLGWVGFEATLRNLLKWVGKKTDINLEPSRPTRKKPRSNSKSPRRPNPK